MIKNLHPACINLKQNYKKYNYKAAIHHPSSYNGYYALPEPIHFADGISVEILQEKDYEETAKVFMSIWLRDNVLYREMKVKERIFKVY